jgi:hypothetical protein
MLSLDVTSAPAGRGPRAALLALVALLPACTLDRSGIPATEYATFEALALVRDVDEPSSRGVAVMYGDPELRGLDTTTGLLAALGPTDARFYWLRYLQERLAPGGRFGDGPWCLVEEPAVVQRGERLPIPAEGLPRATVSAGPIALCEDAVPPPPGACDNPSGSVPALAVTPSGLTFPEVPLGGSAEMTLELRNTGSGRLCLAAPAIDALSAHGGDFELLDLAACSPGGAGGTLGDEERAAGRTFLDAGGRSACTVRVGFTPRAAGERRALVRVSSTDPGHPLQHVPLSGQGLGCAPTVPASPFCVPRGADGCYRRRFRIENDCAAATLTIRSVSVPDWAVDAWDPLPPPLSIAPGGFASLQLTSCATDAPGVLTILHDGGEPINVELQPQVTSDTCTP